MIDGDTLADAVSGTLFVITTATQASDVGVYPTSPSSISSPLRYRLQFVDGQLSITPALVTAVTGNNKRRVGEPNPAFTATFDPADFNLGQNSAALGIIVFATDATELSRPGAYAVTVSGFENRNYAPAPDSVPGVLTISGAQTERVPPDAFNPVIPKFEATPAITQALATVPEAIVATAPAQQHLLPQAQPAWGQRDEDLLYSNDGNRELWGIADIPLPAGLTE